MKMFELLPRPLGSIFRKLTHLTCNSRPIFHLRRICRAKFLGRFFNHPSTIRKRIREAVAESSSS